MKLKSKLTITTDMNCESHNEATISGHIKNSKPIITIDGK